MIQNFTDFDQATQKKLFVKDWEELFHLKFDKSARDYADSLLAKDLQSYSDQDKLFLKMISRQATFMMIKENVRGFDWWKSAPGKIKVVDRDNFSVPEMTFSASKLEKHGSSLEEFVDWLKQNGAKQIKRPQRKKPTFSQYD